ncbi:MAG: hypothetical protein FWC36_01310 [Spirochaetes bacterium]|nr:hypothetical protein [Spirochaetota bacterium]
MLMPLFAIPRDIVCFIRFYNQRIYYAGDTVIIRVELYNNSPYNFSFQVTDPKHFNTTFVLRDITGRELRDKYKFTRKTAFAQPIFFRNMTIQPGEVFAFNIRLNDVLDLSEAGVYFVHLEFFPNLHDNRSIKSNVLTLNIRPSFGVNEIQRIIDQRTGEILRRARKAPDEVVRFTIHALQNSEFDKFFLYLDLENIMLQSQDRRERHSRLSEEGRRRHLEEFRQMLIRAMQADHRTAPPEAIIYRPTSYNIIKTWHTDRYAEVIVMKEFRYAQLIAVREYTYKLRRDDGIWIIYDYTVLNRGVRRN